MPGAMRAWRAMAAIGAQLGGVSRERGVWVPGLLVVRARRTSIRSPAWRPRCSWGHGASRGRGPARHGRGPAAGRPGPRLLSHEVCGRPWICMVDGFCTSCARSGRPSAPETGPESESALPSVRRARNTGQHGSAVVSW